MKYNIPLILFLLLALHCFSCRGREEKEVSSAFDSLVSSGLSDSLRGQDSTRFEEAVNSFSGTHNAITDWSNYGRGDKSLFRKTAMNRYIIIPLLKEQVQGIADNGFTDTSLVFTGNRSNAFVFIIDNGRNIADKLSPGRNALLLLKVKDITESQKLYLVKKHTDFQHKELKVTEFTLTADLIEASGTDAPAGMLAKKFAAQW